MASVSQRAYGWLAVGLALAAAAGVAHASFKTTAPKDVNFAGLWKINAGLSDDAQKIIDRKRGTGGSGTTYTTGNGTGRKGTITIPDAGEILGTIGGMDRSSDPRCNDPRNDPRNYPGGSTTRPDPTLDCGRTQQRHEQSDPEHEEKMAVLVEQLRVAAPEDLEINQRPDELSVQSADATNSCKPGEKTQVMLPGSVLADRECGWEGNTFVIEVKSKTGATRTDRYTLSKGGDRLTISSKLSGTPGKFSGLEIKHVYDRAVSLLR